MWFTQVSLRNPVFATMVMFALVVLGPEKLPDAVRKFTRAYSEFKKMANGFQGEMRSVLEEPMRELRDTADLMREAANIDIGRIQSITRRTDHSRR